MATIDSIFWWPAPWLSKSKSVAALAPIYEAQLLTYLKLGGWKLGLLINFNVLVLKEGIRRRIL